MTPTGTPKQQSDFKTRGFHWCTSTAMWTKSYCDSCRKQSFDTATTHYTSKDGSMEAIDIIEAYNLGFQFGIVLRDILRFDNKGDSLKYLHKAKAYIEREITAREAQKPAPESHPVLQEAKAMCSCGGCNWCKYFKQLG